MQTFINIREACQFTLRPYRAHCTHAVTLTMKQTVWIRNENGRSCVKLDQYHAQRTLRHALNRLNRTLWKNAATRKGQTVLVLPFLEGQKRGDRLHYHLQIGNLPTDITTAAFTQALTDAWNHTDFGDKQIDVQELYGTQHWLNYITKEIGAQDTDCVDWDNVRIPQHLLQD
jgi:hypothetical protein